MMLRNGRVLANQHTAVASVRPPYRRLTERPIDLRKDLVVQLEQPRIVIDDIAVVHGQCAEEWRRVLAHWWQHVHRLQNAARQFRITLLSRVNAREGEGQRRIDKRQRLRNQGEVPSSTLERRRLYSTDRNVVDVSGPGVCREKVIQTLF